jgi:protein involved in polysaccharide export with SLBB domain
VFAAAMALGLADAAELGAGPATPSGLPAPIADLAESLPMVSPASGLGALPPVAADTAGIFGLSLFSRPSSEFDPALAGPVDASYKLGPGDQLVLILSGEVELSYTLPVGREGYVTIPRVGTVFVNNLSVAELEDVLLGRLARVYTGVGRSETAPIRLLLSVARLRTVQVYVVGDVRVPGSYRISSAGTMLTALYAAGGPTANGSLRRIELRRGAATVASFDLYDYLLRGDASRDRRLENGDIIFVPVHGPRVTVLGEVQRPSTYELAAGDALADMLRAAGGPTPRADLRRAQVERILPPAERSLSGRDRLVLDLGPEVFAGVVGGAPPDDGAPRIALSPGDVVRVFPVADRVRNRITVLGNVWSPGAQGLRTGARLSDALAQAGGIRGDTYLGQLLVSRLLPDGRRLQLRTAFIDSTGRVAEDLALQEDDEVRVFSRDEFRPERYVVINGAVRRSGRVAYREGMTLRDLVLLAGGLDEGALLTAAELARLPEDRREGRLARTERVPLDSTYLFERTADGRYLGPPGVPAPASSAPEVALQPYDHVLILRQTDFELPRTVFLGGEVRFPGRYTITSKTERLLDVLQRAGGISPEGHADGVQFWRRTDVTGRIGVDLPRVLRDPRDRDNLLVADGDSIVVPRYNAVVSVEGAVNAPALVPFVAGASADYYVAAAGGPAANADLKRVFVRQPNGKLESVKRRLLLPDGVPAPRAGAVVTVAVEDPNRKRDFVAMAGAVAQVLASTVAIVLIAVRN